MMEAPTSEEPPLLVFDENSERAELLSEVVAARLDLELILERDLPERERKAREDQNWQRLELLSEVRSRAQRDRTLLLEHEAALEDPAAPPPDRDEVQALLAGLDRLLGAVRLQR